MRAAVLLVALLAVGAQADDDPLAQAAGIAAGLDARAPASAFAAAARAYGAAVEAAREAGIGDDDLARLRVLTGELHERTRARIRDLEAAAGEDESALERLYRSSDWTALGFALAAFPYWGAWLELAAGERATATATRLAALRRARLGFRAASVQYFHPGLVYGAWLGLAYLAIAEGRSADAQRLLERLDQGLAADPDNPLRETVALELRQVKARAGAPDAGAPAGSGPLDARQARLLAAEAFATLDPMLRELHVTSRGAGEKIARVLASPHVDDAILAQVLGTYRAKLIGLDLGPWSLLVDAEDAFVNGHWYSAVQKYEAFFAALPRPPPSVSFERFRYQYAVACLKSNLADPAVGIVEPLIREAGNDAELRQAAIKLAYAANAARFQAAATPAHRRSLAQAARRFVAASPADPDADGARLALAQTSDDTRVALAALDGVSGAAGDADARGARFALLARQFRDALAQGDRARARVVAQEATRIAGTLRDRTEGRNEMAALLVQMRVVAGDPAAELLPAIDALERRADLSLAHREALLWSRLELLGTGEALDAWVRTAAAQPLEAWQAERLEVAVRAVTDPARALALAAVLAPAAGSAPATQRRLRLLAIGKRIEAGDAEAAYAQAREFTTANPRSGDGWKLLARAAEATGRDYEAESAWRVITDSSATGADAWWQGMLRRIEIRAASTRPAAACELLAEIAGGGAPVPVELKPRLDAAAVPAGCAAPGSG